MLCHCLALVCALGAAQAKVSDYAKLDAETLNLALTDLITYRGHDNPYREQTSVRFNLVTETRPRTAADAIEAHDKEKWDKLVKAQSDRAKEAAQSLAERLKTKAFVSELTFENKNIRLWTAEDRIRQIDEPALYRTRPVTAWPVGYSKDRRVAVVNLIVPWGIHHAEATYVLVHRAEKWSVLLRQFVYYV